MTRLAPFLAVSLFLHSLLLVAGMRWIDDLTPPGHVLGNEECVFVEVVADKVMIAAAPTPSMIDSAPSPESQPKEEPEPILEEDVVPPPIVARASEDSKADFIQSEEPPPETVEPVEECLQERDNPEEELEEVEEDTEQETPEAVTSIPQVASRQSVFKASRGHDLADFKAKVIAAIKKASYYPKKAARKKVRGEVVVSFRIWKDGRVDGIEIVQSARSKLLDEAATRIVQEAIKDFPRVPIFIRGNHLAYAVPIVFREKIK